jgi:hypothetical protein
VTHITAIPAYGRDYKSKKAVLADWNANKDFLSVGFGGEGYINKQDAAGQTVNIRYQRQNKVVVVSC